MAGGDGGAAGEERRLEVAGGKEVRGPAGRHPERSAATRDWSHGGRTRRVVDPEGVLAV